MGEKFVQYLRLELSVAKMDGALGTLIAVILDVNMILFQYQKWLGITEK